MKPPEDSVLNSKTQEFRYEALQEPETVARYLRALCEGLERGTLSLASGGSQIALEPRGLVHAKVGATSDNERAKLQIELSWTTAEYESLSRQGLTIAIAPGGVAPPGAG